MFCDLIDLSQAYDRVDINTLCTKLMRAEPRGQITEVNEYTCRNTFINTVFGGQPSELLTTGDGTT